jgi:hypothetical protein
MGVVSTLSRCGLDYKFRVQVTRCEVRGTEQKRVLRCAKDDNSFLCEAVVLARVLVIMGFQ